MLSREDILSHTDLKKEKIFVKEWGGEIFVSEMTAESRDEWEQNIVKRDNKDKLVNARAKLIVVTVVDEDGNRLFNDEDVEKIGKLSSKVIDKIAVISQKLNGLSAEELEESKKN